MIIPKYIDKRIEEMKESEKKQAWEELKETDNVYTVMPSIDSLNYRYENLTAFIKMKPLESLQYTSKYYHNVNDIYQQYDYILNRDFFDCLIHPNEYDTIYVTDKVRNRANMICERIDERIKELENNN